MLFFDNRSTFEGPSPQNRFYLHDKGKKTQNDHRMTHHWYSSSLNLVALSGAQLPGGCQNMPSGTPSFHKSHNEELVINQQSHRQTVPVDCSGMKWW
ncbi:hypothetical protein CRM22_006546 [Opisthorchis felineus]|uniref:Uncharacterized protein n=1 Tax=Opisthorchis felineus TaxID=147828 RepID=A0A4S2LKG4_OPIFE|nr:hypothetical protein CRM22_006546 [Opisthorchis felineus]